MDSLVVLINCDFQSWTVTMSTCIEKTEGYCWRSVDLINIVTFGLHAIFIIFEAICACAEPHPHCNNNRGRTSSLMKVGGAGADEKQEINFASLPMALYIHGKTLKIWKGLETRVYNTLFAFCVNLFFFFYLTAYSRSRLSSKAQGEQSS